MDYLEKSFDSAAETSKLVITLSTGVVAFCVTLVNVKASDLTVLSPLGSSQRWLLVSSWMCLLISTVIGIWTQLAITDVLIEGKEGTTKDPNDLKITFPFRLQLFSFLIGMVVLVIYGFMRVFG